VNLLYSEHEKSAFDAELKTYFVAPKYRPMPWRHDQMRGDSVKTKHYKIVVSEMMLQQTQVSRVTPKFTEFMLKFPTMESAAQAPFADILSTWSGLGYNRRAKYLKEVCKVLVAQHRGLIPNDVDVLVKLPGIGKNTAAALVAYCHDDTAFFVETNVRSVLFQSFEHAGAASDASLLKLLKEVLPEQDVRRNFYAIMDWGSVLKRAGKGNNSFSPHYKKQTAFKDSRRALRGAVLRRILESPCQDDVLKGDEFVAKIGDYSAIDVSDVLSALKAENLITKVDHTYFVATA
jgi:A/G-specific adenine glycosylase